MPLGVDFGDRFHYIPLDQEKNGKIQLGGTFLGCGIYYPCMDHRGLHKLTARVDFLSLKTIIANAQQNENTYVVLEDRERKREWSCCHTQIT